MKDLPVLEAIDYMCFGSLCSSVERKSETFRTRERKSRRILYAFCIFYVYVCVYALFYIYTDIYRKYI